MSFLRVAQYVRMSTEHQQYSTENQSRAIAGYAVAHKMQIVRTFSDHGKSGLRLAGRAGLKSLLDEVQHGKPDFDALLVYDVSRWGRFQDADESAFYEFVLRRSGIPVHYCAEPFTNDGSLPSALVKTLKRSMAGEYSRELGVKVFAGQSRMTELGFWQGGHPGYGLRRHLLDSNRKFKQILGAGERKSIQTDRVILAAGPPTEVAMLRWIFAEFTDSQKTEREIAAILNRSGILTDLGRPWTGGVIHQILTNPKYIGANVYNRESSRLRRNKVVNPPEMWIQRSDAFEALIDREVFHRAQRIIAERHRHYTDQELLDRLRALLQTSGRLSGSIINESEDMPSRSAYVYRFGGLPRAYSLIGWRPRRDYSFITANRHIRKMHRPLVEGLLEQLRAEGVQVTRDPKNDLLTINDEYSAAIVLARCRFNASGNPRWLVRLDTHLRPDITIAVRLAPGNEEILDYYLLPALADLKSQLQFATHNPMSLDVFHFNDLSYFVALSKRSTPEEVA